MQTGAVSKIVYVHNCKGICIILATLQNLWRSTAYNLTPLLLGNLQELMTQQAYLKFSMTSIE